MWQTTTPLLLASLILLGSVAAQDGAPTPTGFTDGTGGVTSAHPVFTNIPGQPNSAVPGLPGVSFRASTTSSSIFDRVYGNQSGVWAFTALTDQPTSSDEVVILNGITVAVEGAAITSAPGHSIGAIDTKLALSDAPLGVLFATNSTGATAEDEFILSAGLGGTITVIAQEGMAAPALGAGAVYGSILESPVTMGNGTAGFVADNVSGGLSGTGMDEFALLGSTIIAQTGVTTPLGAASAFQFLDVNDFFTSADGAHYILQGDTSDATTMDDVVVVDGRVVIQEGLALPEFISPVRTGAVGIHMSHAGGWMARGSNADNQDWVVHNGQVIAKTGDPITAGTTEAWSDTEFSACFFAQVSNGPGDTIVGGVTDGATDTNGVIVLNGNQVLLREGDAIDLDGNLLYDDDAFLDTFGNDDFYLGDSGLLHFMATIRNGTGSRIGQGFFELQTTQTTLDGSCAISGVLDASGQPQNTLTVNGFSGGGAHRLQVPSSAALSISMSIPETTSGTPEFALWVLPTTATPADAFPIPPFGALCFAPCIVGFPSSSITLGTSLPASIVCPPAFPGALPFNLPVPGGALSPVSLTLQGVYIDGATLRRSNAIALDIQ